MKKRTRRYGSLFLIVFLLSLVIFQLKARGLDATKENINTAQFAQVRIKRLQQAAAALEDLAAQPLPADISADEKAEAAQYTQWLRDSGNTLNDLASRWQAKLIDIGMIQSRVLSMKQMKEANTSFSRQYSALRNQLLSESRHYQLISNILKTKRDIAESAIENMR